VLSLFESRTGIAWLQAGTRQNDVKARGADFRERALLNWYILRDVCKASEVELRLIMFSIYWMIEVRGGSPPGNCAILEARWLHFLRFLKQIRKRIALTFLTINSLFRQGNPLNWKGTFAPLAPPGKGQQGQLPPPPSSGIPGSRFNSCQRAYNCIFHNCPGLGLINVYYSIIHTS
jgi:hypothetical protein